MAEAEGESAARDGERSPAEGMPHRPLLLSPLPEGEGLGVRARGQGLHHKGTKGSLVDGIAQARQRPQHSSHQRKGCLTAHFCSPLSRRERGWG